MVGSATRYLESFDWCLSVVSSYFAAGIGGVFAIFLFKIVPSRPTIDRWQWIVEGDLPSAYIPLEDANSPAEVFEISVAGMKRWVAYARSGVKLMPKDVPPIDCPASREWADRVEQRINSLVEILGQMFNPNPKEKA